MIHRESVDSRRLHGNSCSLEEEKTQPKTNNGGILPSQTDCLLTLLVLPTKGVTRGDNNLCHLAPWIEREKEGKHLVRNCSS